jgi:hypothetical protein
MIEGKHFEEISQFMWLCCRSAGKVFVGHVIFLTGLTTTVGGDGRSAHYPLSIFDM